MFAAVIVSKRILPVLAVLVVILIFVMYDFGVDKFPTSRTMNAFKDFEESAVLADVHSTPLPVDEQSGHGDGDLPSLTSEGVDIQNRPLGKHLTAMRFTNSHAQSTARSSGQRKRRLPQAIIIGVKKGGTRALIEILKIHPGVRPSSREVHFFDRDENYDLGLDWYREQMPPSLPGEITMEKSPSYFVTPKVPSRIYGMSRDVKLILIVRDPTLRAISDYTQSLFKHPENPPFEETVLDFRGENVNSNWSKIAIGHYARHLRRWLKFFPKDKIHIVSGEDLITNPAVEIKAVEKFLGLEPFITENNFYFNKTKGFFCFVGKRRENGQPKTERHCMGSTKGRKHPRIRQEVFKMVRDYFRPHNEEFYTLANRNFNWP